jgi:ABC-type Na+ efflux pump permease subunit
MKQVMAMLPADLAAVLARAPYRDRVGLLVTGQLLAPMFLLIPLMVATLIGANAFVGEKERNTLEALLYTPATDAEIFVGKTVAALLPALLLSWAGFGAYTVVVNAAAWPVLHRMWFPTPVWWPLIAWVSPAIACLGLIVAVLVSSRATSFVEVNQKLSMLVFPLVALVASQASGAAMFTVSLGMLIGGGLWLVNALLLAFAIRGARRTRLTTKL